MYYELTIDETSMNLLKDKATNINTIKEIFDTKEDVKEFIIDHYGRMPYGRTKIYAGESEEIGFMHSFWVTGIGNGSWYQTDWVTVVEISTKPVLL